MNEVYCVFRWKDDKWTLVATCHSMGDMIAQVVTPGMPGVALPGTLAVKCGDTPTLEWFRLPCLPKWLPSSASNWMTSHADKIAEALLKEPDIIRIIEKNKNAPPPTEY